MPYPLLNSISLPFQAGCESIKASQSKELFVIKRIFEGNQFKYELQDKSLYSLQYRVSMVSKMQAAIYHIALQYPNFIQQLLTNGNTNIALANILLSNEIRKKSFR